MIKTAVVLAIVGVALSYGVSGQGNEMAAGPPAEIGSACDPAVCTVSGDCRSYTFCRRITDIDVSPDDQTGVWVNGQCDDGLWFNPRADNSTVHGGTCDRWGNLDKGTRDEYERECVCNFFSLGACSQTYLYQEAVPLGSDNWQNITLTCPNGLTWDNDRRVCSNKCATH